MQGRLTTFVQRLPGDITTVGVTDQKLLRNNGVIEVTAKVVDLRGETLFLDYGGAIVQVDTHGLQFKRTPKAGESVIAQIARGDTSVKNVLAGIYLPS